MAEKVNIRAVAAAAGVSPATVSRVLNGNSSVDGELARKVLSAAGDLGYTLRARSKPARRIVFIGPGLANNYYAHTVTGVMEVVERAGYQVEILLSHSDPDTELDCLRRAAESGADGLILAPVTDRDPRELVPALASLPIVITGPRHLADGLTHVCLNHEEAAYLATRYLLRLGRRRIVFLVYYWAERDYTFEEFMQEYNRPNRGRFTAYDRYSGYCRALREMGIEPDPSLVTFGGFSYESGFQTGRRFMASNTDFDAIIAPNDRCGAGVLNSLRSQGFRVPEQISLVCLDSDLIAKVVSPTLTSMSSMDYEIGLESAAQLLNLMKGKPARDVQISARLRIEESTHATGV